jgi:hypothetical protein
VIGRANPILAQEFRSTKSENTRWQNSDECDNYLLLHTIVAKGGVTHDTLADFTYRMWVTRTQLFKMCNSDRTREEVCV